MKIMKTLQFAAAVCSAVLLTACATKPAEDPDPVIIVMDQPVIAELEFADFSALGKYNLQPGKIYVSEKVKEIFELVKQDSEVNEFGFLVVRTSGRTLPYPWYLWMVKGEAPYTINFRFIWFDKEGNMLSIPAVENVQTRRCLPGEPVRFSTVAQDEKARQFCLVLEEANDAKEQNAKTAESVKENEDVKETEAVKEAEAVKETEAVK